LSDRPAHCGISREGLPEWGTDYDLERWGTADESGGIIWHHSLPSNKDWDDIRIVTINLEPFEAEGDYRNYRIRPERPLDPYGAWKDEYTGPHKCGRYFDTEGPDAYYDLDNLAFNVLVDYGLWVSESE
jgi:hypothetical protein